jgi:uncharacterized repeat protein (TIGR04138 family)
MSSLAFRDGIMDKIRIRESRFEEQAYLFVLAALEHCQANLEARRHITGAELSRGCRDLALERYGLMAKIVLEHWGVRSTADLGDIVFTLVDLGFLLSQPQDTREEFLAVYDLDRAFEHDYPWNCANCA